MPERPVETYLKADTQLSNLIAKAKLIKKIEILVRAELSLLLSPSADLAAEQMQMISAIHVANYHHGRLSLITDNAAVATRLRFLIPDLTSCLRAGKQLPGLANIVFKTGTLSKVTLPETPKQVSNISSANSELLKATLKRLKE